MKDYHTRTVEGTNMSEKKKWQLHNMTMVINILKDVM